MAVAVTGTVEATAEVDLWVPRDAAGDLESGVQAVVADVDGVATADVDAIADVTPRTTDVRLAATVRVTLADHAAEAAAVAETLADGFGVRDAEVHSVEPADA